MIRLDLDHDKAFDRINWKNLQKFWPRRSKLLS